MSVARALRGRVARLCGGPWRPRPGRALHAGPCLGRAADPPGGAGDGGSGEGERPAPGPQSFWGNKPKSMTKAEFARRVAQLLREEPRKTRDVWGERPMAMSKEEFRKKLYLWREGRLPPAEAAPALVPAEREREDEPREAAPPEPEDRPAGEGRKPRP